MKIKQKNCFFCNLNKQRLQKELVKFINDPVPGMSIEQDSVVAGSISV
jgi:hypothetical protein